MRGINLHQEFSCHFSRSLLTTDISKATPSSMPVGFIVSVDAFGFSWGEFPQQRQTVCSLAMRVAYGVIIDDKERKKNP